MLHLSPSVSICPSPLVLSRLFLCCLQQSSPQSGVGQQAPVKPMMVWAQFCSSGLLCTTTASPGAAHEHRTGHGVVAPHFLHLLSLPSCYLEHCLHPCYPHIRAQAHTDWHVFESRSAHVHLIPRATFLLTPCSPQSLHEQTQPSKASASSDL